MSQDSNEGRDGRLRTTVLLADLCADLKDHAAYWKSFRAMTDKQVRAEMKDSDLSWDDAVSRFRGVAAGRATEARNNATSISAIIRSANESSAGTDASGKTL